MTEYKTFDNYVRTVFKIEPTKLTHISPEEQKKKTVEITVDELINIWNELTERKTNLEELTITNDYQRVISDKNERISFLEAQLNEAKEIMNIAIEGIKRWSVVGGYERPFIKEAEILFNLFFEKTEQFLKEV